MNLDRNLWFKDLDHNKKKKGYTPFVEYTTMISNNKEHCLRLSWNIIKYVHSNE